MGKTIKTFISRLCLVVAAICLGLYMFNFIFEVQEVKDENRKAKFIHEVIDNNRVSNFFNWTQEDNDRDRMIRKIVLVTIGTCSTTIGLVTFPRKR